MVISLILRFILGGVIVSAFAVLGDTVWPKSFAGIFGAAPAVALSTLGLAFVLKGGTYVGLDGRSMILGAIALCLCNLLIAHLVWRRRWGALAATSVATLGWLAVALCLWALLLR